MTAPRFTIRPPGGADRAQWEPLWQGYLRFYQSSLPDEHSNLLWQRILDPAHEIECRVAESDEEILDALRHGQLAFFVAINEIARSVEDDVTRFELDREQFLDMLRRVEDDVQSEVAG